MLLCGHRSPLCLFFTYDFWLWGHIKPLTDCYISRVPNLIFVVDVFQGLARWLCNEGSDAWFFISCPGYWEMLYSVQV